MSERSVTTRFDMWTLDHPWIYTAVCAVLFAGLFGRSVLGGSIFGSALIFSVAWPLWGWSASRGPARRWTERRLAKKGIYWSPPPPA